MSDKTVKTVRTVLGIVLAVISVLCAISLIVSCVQIYRSGPRPFTPENIKAAWSSIAIFVWLFVAAVIVAGIWQIIYPAPVQKQKGKVHPELRLSKAKARLARKQYSDELLLPLTKQEVYVKSMRITAVAVCVLSAVYPLIYLYNPDHFTSIDTQLNAQVTAAVLPALGCAAIALVYCCIVRLLVNASCERALAYAKSIMLMPAPAAEKKAVGTQSKELPAYAILVARIAIITVAVLLIAFGIFNGGMDDVLQKAIRICTECIGLG